MKQDFYLQPSTEQFQCYGEENNKQHASLLLIKLCPFVFSVCSSEMVTILKGHTGLVKGVTWDPVGKYLSSQSDDKSLRIWRTIDWQQEAVIEEPFKEV